MKLYFFQTEPGLYPDIFKPTAEFQRVTLVSIKEPQTSPQFSLHRYKKSFLSKLLLFLKSTYPHSLQLFLQLKGLRYHLLILTELKINFGPQNHNKCTMQKCLNIYYVIYTNFLQSTKITLYSNQNMRLKFPKYFNLTHVKTSGKVQGKGIIINLCILHHWVYCVICEIVRTIKLKIAP